MKKFIIPAAVVGGYFLWKGQNANKTLTFGCYNQRKQIHGGLPYV